jgi:hypothetical protein
MVFSMYIAHEYIYIYIHTLYTTTFNVFDFFYFYKSHILDFNCGFLNKVLIHILNDQFTT